jgi:hypothetical protein
MGSGVQIEKWFKAGIEVYKASAGILIPACLVALLISMFTFGILAGPMLAGLMMIGLRLHDRSEPRPEIGDLFKGFDHFGQSFLLAVASFIAMLAATVILSVVPILGNLIALLVYGLVSLVAWFAVGLIVEKGMAFWPAILEALGRMKAGFWAFLAFGTLISFVGGLGGVLCGVGACLTMPLFVGAVVAAYRDIWAGEPADAPAADAEPAPPVPDAAAQPTQSVDVVEDAPASQPEEAPSEDEGEEKPPQAT